MILNFVFMLAAKCLSHYCIYARLPVFEAQNMRQNHKCQT